MSPLTQGLRYRAACDDFNHVKSLWYYVHHFSNQSDYYTHPWVDWSGCCPKCHVIAVYTAPRHLVQTDDAASFKQSINWLSTRQCRSASVCRR